MQRLTVITGMPGEGKTTELVDEYIKFHTDHMIRKFMNPYIILCGDKVNPDKVYDMVMKRNNGYVTESDVKILVVKNLEDLEQLTKCNLNNKDAIFYIDDIDKIIDMNHVLRLINTYPNKITNYSCDIVCTVTR